MRNNLGKVVGLALLLIFVLAGGSVLLLRQGPGDIQQQLAETRRQLREQGFKTDLADFHLAADPDERARESALTFFGPYVQPTSVMDRLDLLPPLPDGSAVVLWKQSFWKQNLTSGEDDVVWADVHDSLDEYGPQLDAACDAVLAGPIQFDLDASRGSAMLLPHLATMRRLEQSLAARTLLELHEGHADSAWTNLLALTRLVTAWKIEPVEVSQLVRFGMVWTAFNATWQTMQYDQWPDEKLAALQHEWESADFFSSLPDAVAFQGACQVQLCQLQRQQPLTGGRPLSEIARQPGTAIAALKLSWNAARYRSYGTFVDEKNLLVFYQQRELEMRRAIASPTWQQMQALPGVTNPPVFTSPYPSPLQIMIRMGAMRARVMGDNSSLLGRAAVAEAQRRVAVAAIALERFRLRQGAYPRTLAELAPEFLKAAPVDIMDGNPLRYRLTDDGHFVLYSVGLDCIDDGGNLRAPSLSPTRRPGFGMAGPEPGENIVWPRPAGAAAVAAEQQQATEAARDKANDDEQRQSAYQWQHADKRQGRVQELLEQSAVTNVPDVNFQGRPLSEILKNPDSAGTNQLSLAEMFTLRQLMTGGEPETVTFELPVAYDVATNIGHLYLMIDPDYKTGDEEGSAAQQVECNRAADGNVLLVWHTIYESPGKHALQAAFYLGQNEQDNPDVRGPFLPFTLNHLCQFSLGSANYDLELGARFHARLPEPRGVYSIECVTTNGVHLATLTGSTTNGEFDATWNLVDDHGHRLNGETFNSIVHITLPDSGRTQTLRGP